MFFFSTLFPDDCLWLLRIICLDIFENKLMKVLLKVTFFSILALTLVQTILFLYKSDFQYFLKYHPLYCGSFFVLLVIYSIPVISDSVVWYIKRAELWPIDFSGPVVERRIKKQSLFMNIFTAVNTMIGIMSGIFHALPLTDDKDIFYSLATFEEFFPRWSYIFEFCYRCGFIILAIMMSATFNMFIYATTHMRFQAYMITQHLEMAIKNVNACTDEQVYNEEHQKELRKEFTVCIDRHSLLIRNGQRIINKQKTFIFLYSVSGTVFFISFIGFLFSGSFEGRYPRLVTLAIPAVSLFVTIIVCGQKVEEISSKGYDVLLQMGWYNLNYVNRKIYMISLLNTFRGFRIQFSESIAINYELAFAIGKKVYSILSVMGYFTNII